MTIENRTCINNRKQRSSFQKTEIFLGDLLGESMFIYKTIIPTFNL